MDKLKYNILFKNVEKIRKKVRNIGMTNINGIDIKKKEEIQYQYDIAKRELFKAEKDLLFFK